MTVKNYMYSDYDASIRNVFFPFPQVNTRHNCKVAEDKSCHFQSVLHPIWILPLFFFSPYPKIQFCLDVQEFHLPLVRSPTQQNVIECLLPMCHMLKQENI